MNVTQEQIKSALEKDGTNLHRWAKDNGYW